MSGRSPDSTRVVLDLTAPASYTLFTLSGPERIVIDFDQIDADVKSLAAAGERGRRESACVSASAASSGLRIVLDVNSEGRGQGIPDAAE